MAVGEGGIIYLSLQCHHQNDCCIKMGSDESHFNVSLIVRYKVTRRTRRSTALNIKREAPGEKSKNTLVLPP